MMWRKKGAGQVYTYLPPSFERMTFKATWNPSRRATGTSAGREASYIEPGEWPNVAQRIRLNNVSEANIENWTPLSRKQDKGLLSCPSRLRCWSNTLHADPDVFGEAFDSFTALCVSLSGTFCTSIGSEAE
jgi:hypothetical protein